MFIENYPFNLGFQLKYLYKITSSAVQSSKKNLFLIQEIFLFPIPLLFLLSPLNCKSLSVFDLFKEPTLELMDQTGLMAYMGNKFLFLLPPLIAGILSYFRICSAFSSRTGIGRLQVMSQIWPTTCSYK